jgi:hypothetical protein
MTTYAEALAMKIEKAEQLDVPAEGSAEKDLPAAQQMGTLARTQRCQVGLDPGAKMPILQLPVVGTVVHQVLGRDTTGGKLQMM